MKDEKMKNKDLCFERDANRCRACGGSNNLRAVKLKERDGDVSYYLSNLVTLCDDCDNKRESAKSCNRVGVLLCGGKATRLYPITKTTNKHVLPIGIIPMAFYPINTLRKLGVNRVLVVVDQFASSIMETLGSGKMFGMNFTYKIQDGAFGIADALHLAKDFANDDDEIICILGDNIFDNKEFDNGFNWEDDSRQACIFVKEVANPQDYGVAVVDSDGNIVQIIEKPDEHVGNLGVVGLYIYRNKDVFDIIDEIGPSDRGELEISSLNDCYAFDGTLQCEVVKGYWADCGGSIQRYCEASLYGAKQAKVTEEEIDGFKSVVFDDK